MTRTTFFYKIDKFRHRVTNFFLSLVPVSSDTSLIFQNPNVESRTTESEFVYARKRRVDRENGEVLYDGTVNEVLQ